MSVLTVVGKAGILCDEIRREENGKELLIGAYSGELNLPESPVYLEMQALLIFELAGLGKQDIYIKIELHPFDTDKSEVVRLAQGQVTLSSSEDNDGSKREMAIPVPTFGFELTQSSWIKISWSKDNKKWKKILRKAVVIDLNFET